MKKLSLKTRLILSFFAAATLMMGSVGVLSWYESREQIDEFFDTYQLLLARQLSSADWQSLNTATQKNVNKLVDELDDDGEEDDEALSFAIFDSQGKMVFNDNEKGKRFIYHAQVSGFKNQQLGHKRKMWRILWMPSFDQSHKIAVGQELEYRDEMVFDLMEEILLPWVYGLVGLLVLMVLLVHLELLPLKKIANLLSKRKPDDLSALPTKDVPKEVIPLVEAMNLLFAKIEQMLKRERSFIADSAHEMRSPLTALKVQLEVLELSGDDKESHAKALNNLKIGVERSTRLVEQLLAISRLESQISKEPDELLDWQTMLDTIINEQAAAWGRKINVQVLGLQQYGIKKGQGILWSLLMRNLIDNAVRYGPDDTEIKIEFNEAGVVVSNSGVGVDEKHLSHLGERFFRPAGQKAGGSGLGLSIVEKIAGLHGYQVRYENTDGVFRVIIEG